MCRSICLALFLLTLSPLTARVAAAAEDLDCKKYDPAVGKVVSVPCGEPAPGAAAAPTAQEDKTLTKLKKNLVELTGSLKSASGDAEFRDSFCTLMGTGQWLREVKEKEVQQRLTKEHEALDAKLGDRGRNIYTALSQDVMKMVLDTPVDNSSEHRLEQTSEGQAFLKARDGLHLACNCMREPELPKRIVCCDSCSQEALQQKGNEKDGQ